MAVSCSMLLLHPARMYHPYEYRVRVPFPSAALRPRPRDHPAKVLQQTQDARHDRPQESSLYISTVSPCSQHHLVGAGEGNMRLNAQTFRESAGFDEIVALDRRRGSNVGDMFMIVVGEALFDLLYTVGNPRKYLRLFRQSTLYITGGGE